MTRTLLFLIGISLYVASAHAQGTGRQYTEIAGSGQALFRIAIAPVIDGGGAGASAATMTSVLNRDFMLSGMFSVIDARSFLANLSAEGTGLSETQVWANVGAQAVIKAKASGGSVDFYLYDIAKGRQPVLTRTYRYSDKQARRVAHQFGDEVVKYYTKEDGIFTSRIAFASGSGKTGQSYIHIMDYDGYSAGRVSRTGNQNVAPALANDGRLAYTSFLWRNPDLFVMSGGRANRVAKWQGLNTAAAWSPRGNAIALTLSKDGNSEIYIITPSGGIVKRLTNNAAIDTSPTWSPDGSQIAFVSNRAGSPQIYVMATSGGGEAKRVTFRGTYNQEPDWCPRAATPLVAFTGRDERGSYDIYTVNVQTGEVKRITQGQGSNQSPTWAPNGRLLAFASSRGGIWVATAEGFNQQPLYRGIASTPSWGR